MGPHTRSDRVQAARTRILPALGSTGSLPGSRLPAPGLTRTRILPALGSTGPALARIWASRSRVARTWGTCTRDVCTRIAWTRDTRTWIAWTRTASIWASHIPISLLPGTFLDLHLPGSGIPAPSLSSPGSLLPGSQLYLPALPGSRFAHIWITQTRITQTRLSRISPACTSRCLDRSFPDPSFPHLPAPACPGKRAVPACRSLGIPAHLDHPGSPDPIYLGLRLLRTGVGDPSRLPLRGWPGWG